MPKPDPSWFPLVAHKVGLRLYNLSAGLSYVSIKDQVVRACALVDSLHGAEMLKSSSADASAFDVLVIGAGAAGVTAAWRAASLGMRVCVVEKADGPFSAQAGCNDRIVSFSMYDWPESFSSAGLFPSLDGLPWAGSGLDDDRFPCYADTQTPLRASVHAANWKSRLDVTGTGVCSSTAIHPINWHFKSTATYSVPPQSMFTTDSGTLQVVIKDEMGVASHLSTANVIVATGIGLERPVGPYQPAPFWHDDPRAPWHRTPAKSKRSVVISGGGDGAIQDTMKSLWKSEPADLIPVVESLLGPAYARARNQAILAAERHAERQLLWGVDDTTTYRSLQAVYDVLISKLDAKRFSRWSKKFLSKDMHVHWVVGPSGVFSKAYPLNRMLGSVLRRPEFKDHVTFYADSLESVTGAGGNWHCATENGLVLSSDFPPIVRHGVETQDVDVDSFDRDTLRKALSRAPVPFKPFDF
jgi:hypothetical protein